jgi:hypothetical protein
MRDLVNVAGLLESVIGAARPLAIGDHFDSGAGSAQYRIPVMNRSVRGMTALACAF